MKELTIFQNGSTFAAGSSSETINEMHNLTGSIFDLWATACDLLKTDAKDYVAFKFNEFQYACDQFNALWNDDLEGYAITFSDGKTAQTQTYTEKNCLHAGFGDKYLERYTECDDELNEDQESLIEYFVKHVNKLKHHYA